MAKLVVRLERGNRRKFIRNLSRRPSGLEAPVYKKEINKPTSDRRSCSWKRFGSQEHIYSRRGVQRVSGVSD